MSSLRRTIPAIIVGLGFLGVAIVRSTNVSTQTAAERSVSATESSGDSSQLRTPDVIYVPTPTEVVERMLEIAEVGQDDILYDLGSGDGRIPIAAVRQRGVRRAVGIDIDPQRIRQANENAQRAGVNEQVRFLNQDLFQSDFSEATVVTLYLLPNLNIKLRPQLFEQLEPGVRIVSHSFDMGMWQPDLTERVEVDGQTHTIYLWTIPENIPDSLRS